MVSRSSTYLDEKKETDLSEINREYSTALT